MVRLRLMRLGRRNTPFYRLNAIDKRTRRDGRILENLGWYDPVNKDESKQIELKSDRIKHWLEHGAQPSDTVADLLAKHDLLTPKLAAERDARRAHRRAIVDKRLEAKRVEEAAAAKAEAEAKAAEEAAKKAEEAAKAAEEAAKAAEASAEEAPAETSE